MFVLSGSLLWLLFSFCFGFVFFFVMPAGWSVWWWVVGGGRCAVGDVPVPLPTLVHQLDVLRFPLFTFGVLVFSFSFALCSFCILSAGVGGGWWVMGGGRWAVGDVTALWLTLIYQLFVFRFEVFACGVLVFCF